MLQLSAYQHLCQIYEFGGRVAGGVISQTKTMDVIIPCADQLHLAIPRYAGDVHAPFS